jgi:hypothetical protein
LRAVVERLRDYSREDFAWIDEEVAYKPRHLFYGVLADQGSQERCGRKESIDVKSPGIRQGFSFSFVHNFLGGPE